MSVVRDLSPVSPVEVGLSPAGLARLDETLAGFVDERRLAGVQVLIARHGRVAHSYRKGFKSLESGEALADDTIFRIFSMTKPVTGAAMMILHGRGLWSPDDPLEKHLPELAGLKVMVGADEDGAPILAEPDHPPTLAEAMNHTAGFSYGFNPDPVDALYRQADIWGADSLSDFVARVGRLPLAHQPGQAWRYSIGMDIQGAVIERLSGRSLPDFMREELFEPLGMVDTGFHHGPDKLARLSDLYRWSPRRGLVAAEATLVSRDPAKPPKVPSGGGGLLSTARDYLRFGQMMLDRGRFEGRQIIPEASVALMTRNHLSDAILNGGFGIGFQSMRPGYGHGFDCAVFHDPAAAGSKVGQGTFQWDGAAGTWFWVDPVNDLVFVGLIQRFMDETSPPLQRLTQDLVAEALVG